MSAPKRTIGGVIESLLFAGLLLPLGRYAPPLSRLFRPAFVWMTWIVASGWRRSLMGNARAILGANSTPKQQAKFGRRVLYNMQTFIANVAAVDRRTVPELAATVLRIEGTEHLLPLLGNGKGLILASAHMGPFESAAAVLRAFTDAPVHVVYAADRVPSFERMRARARTHLGIVEHPVSRGVQTWVELRDALDRGEIVTVLADRVQEGQPWEPAEFLGATARFPTGPIRLASLAGVPIVPFFCASDESGVMRLWVEPAIEVNTPDRVDSRHPALRSLVGAIERAVRFAPEQWLTVHMPWVAASDAR